MFNEGLDISDIDMVMFLRHTESPAVFLQQLGRGLRKSRGKEFLNVLDFIGNYEKAGSPRFCLVEDHIPVRMQAECSRRISSSLMIALWILICA